MNLFNSAMVRRGIGAPVLIAAAAMASMLVLATGQALAARPAIGQPAVTEETFALPMGMKTQADAHVLIELSEPPAVLAYSESLSRTGGQASSAAISAAATRAQIAKNVSQQATLVNAMKAAGIQYREIYRVQRAMNGVAVIVPHAQLATLRTLPGVKAVRTIVPSVPTSATSVPFVGANQVWQGIPGAMADGTGIKIGIIDTGIDYQHANFGGSGLNADYLLNDRVSLANGVFPTAKVVGGTDLVGDNYDANGSGAALIPVPDVNPTDCGGHGSHVAGTAAGLGVTTGGATYVGPYDTPSLSALRILPGMAPKASLYAIRVFGCGGSTDVVVEAIDYALDPNGDGDLSDHLDIINMSLGSSAGSLSNLDAQASENASLSGMVVVASAGNANDTYMILGSPSVATRAISVAASLDGQEPVPVVTITVPGAIAGSYLGATASFGAPITSTPVSGDLGYGLPQNGCVALTNPAAIAGKIAVLTRGTCAFTVKAKNAQNAGAIAVIIVNNTGGAAPGLGGTDATVTIPALGLGQADGQLIQAQLLLPTTVTGSIASVGGGDTLASFSSRGPNNAVPTGLKPDITAPGVNIVSTQTGMTCNGTTTTGCFVTSPTGILPGSTPLTISGTSMAAPHVAGLMALLKQLHPTWTVEELKASAMNGAVHDLTTGVSGAGFRYGAGRVGAGRIDAVATAPLQVAAYNADGSGAVSLTFPGEILGTVFVTKRLRVVNHGASSATFALAIDTVVDNPGVSFALPGGSSLTLAAGQTIDIDVQMSAVANQVKHTYDPTIYLTQGGNPRYSVTEETAYVTMTSGPTKLRVPLYVTPYAVGQMSAGGVIPTGGAPTGSANLTLSGTPVCTGTYSPGPPATCAASFPLDVQSLVSPFELQLVNPRNPLIPAVSNVRYAGILVDSGTGLINFGFNTWGPWSQPTESKVNVEFTIYDAGGVPKFILFPYRLTVANNASNVYGTGVFNLTTGTFGISTFANLVSATGPDTRIFENDVLFMSASLGAVGLTPTSTVNYSVETYDPESGALVESSGPLVFNAAAPGVDFGPFAYLFDDLPGSTIPVTWNVPNLIANGSKGALLLHHHNAAGTTAERLLLQGTTIAATSGGGQSATINTNFGAPLKATVTDALGNPVVGATVTFVLPPVGVSARFPGNSTIANVITDASGVATSPVLKANGIVGSYNATASSSGAVSPASFVLSNTPLAVAPVVVSAVSRKVHGAAGTFDLPLLLAPPVNANPTTEPRNGPTQMIVFTFDKPVTGGTATVSEGTATVGTVTFSGAEMQVNLTGVTDIQYVTVAVSAVIAADGGTGGTGSARIGFLAGDVNQTRTVTLSDVAAVNGQLSQPVGPTNYLKDVNVNGAISLSDKSATNSALTHALPPP